MSEAAHTLSCTRCGAGISADDLGGGLAVRVDGELVCQMCVDTLPGEAVVRINQVRALRGLEVTTYSVKNAKTPRLQLFSFTTSANITNHRRKLASDGFFEAPPLPPPSERQRLPTPSTAKVVTDRVARGQMPARAPMLIAAGGTVVVLGGIALAFALATPGKKTTPTGEPTTEVPAPQPVKAMKTRLDYSVDPLQAWTQATQDHDCPTLVLQTIAQELTRKRSTQLDDADVALAERRLDDAIALANTLTLPDDIAFRDLRQRESDLRARLLSSRTVASLTPPVNPVPPANQVPAVTTPLPTPLPTPPPDTPIPPLEPLATTPGAVVVAGADGEVRLQADTADITGTTIERTKRGNILALINWQNADHRPRWRARIAKAGNYRVAIRVAAGGSNTCPLLMEVGDQRIVAPVSGTGGWSTFRMAPIGVVTLPEGELVVQAGAQDPKNWHALNLAEIQLTPTTDAASPTVAPPIAVTPTPPPDKPVVPTAMVTIWPGEFVTGGRDKPPRRVSFDGSEHIPAGLPGGVARVARSTKSQALKRHAAFLDLAGASAAGGGVVVLLHPGRNDRDEIIVSLTDSKGTTVRLDPLPLPDDEWTSLVVPMPTAGPLDPSGLITLALEDGPKAAHIPDDAGFLIAGAVSVNGRAATAADLAVRPSALLTDPNRLRNLPRLLDILAKSRKKPNAQKLIEPGRVRFLLGSWSKDQDWRMGMRKQLEPLVPGKQPATMMSELNFSDTWLEAMTKAKDAALDPQMIHMGVLWTGGDELATFPDPQQAITNFWKRRLDQILDAGVLPIVVIGPNRQKDATRAQADQLWQQLIALAPVRLYGLPVVDLRALPTADDGSWDPATATLAAQLVVDAIGETVFTLRRLGAIK